MSEQQSLEGKKVVIAGGAKNLGGLMSRRLAARGADVAIHYNSAATRGDAESTLAAVEALGRTGVVLTGDLTDGANVAALFADAKTQLGRVDIAINTVGKVLRKPIVDTTDDEVTSMLDVNAKSAFFFLREAGRVLEDDGKVVMLVTSLLAAFINGYATYAGGKSPVEHFVRAAAKEFAARGISVNSVAPGPMDTPFLYGQEDADSVEFFKSQGMGHRLTKIEDIVPVIEFLVSDGAWITGQTILANGGFTTR